MTPALKWRLTSPAGLLWQDWGDQSVAFSPVSGDTHLVDLVSRSGLLRLQQGACTGEEICLHMASELELAVDDDLREYVSRLLGQLRELGLVETAHS